MPAGLAVDTAAGAVERWRDLALEMWIAAGVATLVWFVVFGALAAVTTPRRVAPGPASLELGGGRVPFLQLAP
jgi:hypothetical protein